jgi:hypothetical protein
MRLGKLKLFERREIGYGSDPLLTRWTLFRIPAFGIYIHKFLRSDYDRALHDHPWPFVSIILKGGYYEVHDQTTDGLQEMTWYGSGSVLVRSAEWRHRVKLEEDPRIIRMRGLKRKTAWTLIFVGRRSRKWGFWLPSGWCWWRKHDPERNICGEEILHPEGGD